jgi:hypothetical protein
LRLNEHEEKIMRVQSYVIVLATLAAASGVLWTHGRGQAQQQPATSQGNWPQSQANFPQSGGGGWGGGWGGGVMHASTAEQGAMMGMADMMQAAGSRNLMNSQALGFVEDAKRKNIDNRMYGTDAYFQMRKTNKEARAAEAAPKASRSDLERYARQRAPSRLSPSELDPLTGTIAWPAVLREDAYKPYREQLEKLYLQRANIGALTGSERGEVQQAINALQADLKQNLRNYVPQDYVQAKKFIEGLNYELFAPSS